MKKDIAPRLISVVSMSVILIFLTAAAASALTVIYVDDDAPSGGDGSWWAVAYADLQDALDVAKATEGDVEIRVAGGVYRPSLRSEPDVPRTETFTLLNGVAIRGGYRGLADGGYPDDRDIAQFETVLSGDLNGDDLPDWEKRDDNSLHVVTGSSTDSTAVLAGITITAGNADTGDYYSVRGGGLHNVDGSPTLLNCTFRGNSARLGGGILNYLGNGPSLSNCVFTGNWAVYGGGMYNNSASGGRITNCTFVGNTAEFTGGGIANSGQNGPTLVNCIISGNQSESNPQIEDDSIGMDVAYSCVQGNWPGMLNIDTDPLFADADGADNVFGTADDNLHLRPNSPCINRGDDIAVTGIVGLDYEGEDRIQQCRVDLGADETPYPGADCNSNGVSDACDVTQGDSPDCNTNGIPDECEFGWSEDCNANGAPDLCDISSGLSQDCHSNGIPDECETLPIGVVYVDDDATGGLTNGLTWADAYVRLTDALYYADCTGTVSEIRVAEGIYKPSAQWVPGKRRSETFALINGVAIRGGYRGLSGGGDPDDRDIPRFESILSGDIGVDGVHSDNAYHVVTASGTDEAALLEGVTITAGNADSGLLDRFGGGIYNSSGSPTISNCAIKGNTAEGGGGMCNTGGSSPTIIDSHFVENIAGQCGNGGGMYNFESSPTLTRCAFLQNSVNSVAGYGGGIYNN